MTGLTPEQVVQRYRELDAKAITGSMGIHWRDGRWEPDPAYRSCHCALGVMMRGQVTQFSDRATAVKTVFKIDYVSFYVGFDTDKTFEESFQSPIWDGIPVSREDFELGRTCRDAVTANNLWDGGRP